MEQYYCDICNVRIAECTCEKNPAKASETLFLKRESDEIEELNFDD